MTNKMKDSVVNKMREVVDSSSLQERLQQLKDGDMAAFDYIYHASKKNVYFAIYLIFKNEDIATDLMQETYIDFLDHINKIRHDIDIIPYLVTMGKNHALNYYKRHKKEKEFVLSLKEESFHEEVHMESELYERIKTILSDKELMVFSLRVLADYSFKEISMIKGIPVGTLTWLYQEARKKLQAKLGGVYNG